MPNQPPEDGRALVGRLYDAYGASLYRYATMILADAQAAEDAVHQVFTSLLDRPRVVEQEAHYLRRAVRNECYSALRRRRSDEAPERVPLEPAGAGTSPEERLALERALATLPADQREVVHLHVYEGHTFQAIAETTDASINTVASRYRYALARLRQQLTEEKARR